MSLSGNRNEAKDNFKEAKRHSRPSSKEFDLDIAIRYLEEAILLNPDKKRYQQEQDKIRTLISRRSLKFSMQGTNYIGRKFPEGRKGVVLEGKVEQGTIRNGDVVQIKGHQGTIYEVVSPTGKGFAGAGQKVELAIVTDWGPGWKGILKDMYKRGLLEGFGRGESWKIEGV